jgi:hypothetical protein
MECGALLWGDEILAQRINRNLEVNLRIALVAAAMGWTVPVYAHSWYPYECCFGKDCHEADTVTEMPDGSAQVAVGNEMITVPRSFKRRASPDFHYHLCYGKLPGKTVVYCFFEPTSS